MLNQFNSVARFYDGLAKLVFGNSIRRAQIQLLDFLPQQGKVLIIGGGTGWLLEEIMQKAPALRVLYVEASSEMIRLSKQRVQSPQVTFVHGTHPDIPSDERFDVVITCFFLDVFPEAALKSVMQQLHTHLKPKGYWLFADFVSTSQWWQQLLLKIMFLFFQATSKLKSKHLPDFTNYFQALELKEVWSKHYYSGMIKSVAYRSVIADRKP